MLFSCSSDSETQDESDRALLIERIEYTYQEPEKVTSATTMQFESSIRIGSENRKAVMLILRGILSSKKPFKFEVARVHSGKLYRDIDKKIVPNRFITRAQILDKNENILWEDKIDSLFQTLEYLQLLINGQSTLKLNINQVYKFIKQEYPELLEFGILVPTGIEGGESFRLVVPDKDNKDVIALNVKISEILANAKASPLQATTKMIVDNGKPVDKIDIALLADGYSADEEDKFNKDASAIAERFFKAEPFTSHAEDFNFHTVFIPSKESGAGYDCVGDPKRDQKCKNDVRDTIFQTTFVVSGLAEKFNFNIDPASARAAMPLQVAKVFEASTLVPADQMIIISNTTRRSGFAGLYFSTVTAYDERLDFPATAVHELGHSFGLLGDEYSNPGDPCLANEPRVPLPPNITMNLNPLKWSALVDEDAPIPTPISMANSVKVGAYAGGYSCEGTYRPAANCKMLDSNSEFCPVCAQQLVSRVTEYIDPITTDGYTMKKVKNGFEIITESITNRDTLYYFNQKMIPSKNGRIFIAEKDLNLEWQELKIETQVVSSFVKIPSLHDKKTSIVFLRKIKVEEKKITLYKIFHSQFPEKASQNSICASACAS